MACRASWLGRMLAYPRFRAMLLGGFALFAVALTAAGAIAAFFPARRAVRADPMAALRND